MDHSTRTSTAHSNIRLNINGTFSGAFDETFGGTTFDRTFDGPAAVSLASRRTSWGYSSLMTSVIIRKGYGGYSGGGTARKTLGLVRSAANSAIISR